MTTRNVASKSRVVKIFEREMIFRTLPITPFQIFCKIILNLKVNIKRVIEPDDLSVFYSSGGMMVLHEHKTQRSTYIDFRETAPSGATKDMFNKNYHQAMRVSTDKIR